MSGRKLGRWSACLVVAFAISAETSAFADFTSSAAGANSGLCIDVEGASSSDGANIIQWTCHGNANQQMDFRLSVPSLDTYAISFRHSSKCMEVAGSSMAAGANIQQATCNGSPAQQFRLVERGTSFALVNVQSGLVVEVADDSLTNLATIQQNTDSGGLHQQFSIPNFAPPGPSAGPNVIGQWGPVISWPLIPVSIANLPDGRILSWSGSERETWPRPEQNGARDLASPRTELQHGMGSIGRVVHRPIYDRSQHVLRPPGDDGRRSGLRERWSQPGQHPLRQPVRLAKHLVDAD